MQVNNQNQDEDLVTMGIWDGVGLIEGDSVPEETVYKIDFTDMLKALEEEKQGVKQ